jgi:hypothetical protein
MSSAGSKEDSEVECLTASIPDAGRMAGLGKNASYRAADAGLMPTIDLGGKKRVPLKRWKAICEGDVAQTVK